jgi:hypothetical protein
LENRTVEVSAQNSRVWRSFKDVASGGDGTLRSAHSEDAAAKGVRRSDLERYGDVAESLVVAALVKSGLPLRKAKALASTVRAEADQIVVH